jgi:hypothetical protein
MSPLVLACLTLIFVGAEQPPSKIATIAQPAADASPKRRDFRVIVWYRRDRPLDTFKYQTYDLRKGEYTDAVDDWLELMRAKFGKYEVIVREVTLSQESGTTESLKVGSVVKRELLAAAALEGVFVGEPGYRGSARPPSLRQAPPAAPDHFRSSPRLRPGAPGAMNLNPPGPSFPFPIPYPRPHP